MSVVNIFSNFINKFLSSQKLKLDYLILVYSNYILNFLKSLKKHGYILNIYLFRYFFYNIIIVKLKYFNNLPIPKIFKRVSKNSLKIYKGYKYLPVFMNGLGTVFVSTNKGIYASDYCRKNGVGGEIMCYVF